MKKIYKYTLLLLAIFLTTTAFAQNSFFNEVSASEPVAKGLKRTLNVQSYVAYKANMASLKSFLWTLPSEKSVGNNRASAPIISLPMPDGKMGRFHVWESNIMAPELAAKLPEMRQFLGQGIDDPYATVRFDYNPYTGIHAQILSARSGRIFIDPFAAGSKDFYISYFARNASSPVPFTCEVGSNAGIDNPNPVAARTAAACLGTTLRTYRLALACTGEYAVAVAGANPTVPAVAAAMLTAVNRVTGVYETEVAFRMVLIANNNDLIYLNGATDPYTNNSGSAMLTENINNVNAVIGFANYDIGHVFSTGGGGVAFLGSVCNSNKAGGVTGLPNPVGDPFYIDYVAHEMGHQYGGSHTFNSATGNCAGGNRTASAAYEVGSGTTIQAYAGICGSDNIQNNSDAFFHAYSFDQFSNKAVGAGDCSVQTPTGNTLPIIAPLLNNNLTIPIGTPFTLNGTATDANGDALTYSWEQMDLGPAGAWNAGATSTTAPLFKFRVPKTTGERTFPDIAVILAGYPANPAATLGGLKGETLPQVARAMNFRLTVRDNRAGGGGTVSSGTTGCQSTTPYIVNVAGTAPFALTSPNGGQSYAAGSIQNITWNVVGTNAAPFNVANVRVSLSNDGGLTYPILVSASTPNDGSEMLAIPGPATTTARIKVEAVGNIFFDISDANFTITAPVNAFDFGSVAPITVACGGPATATSSITTTVSGTFTTPIVLTASGLPTGVTAVFAPNPLIPGNTVIMTLSGVNLASFGTYSITVTGTAGTIVRTVNVPLSISEGAGPVFSINPMSQTVCAGSPVTFTSLATGALSYQWAMSTNGGTTYTNISGATSASYSITSTTAAMNGNLYRVTATGQCGTTNSTAATLTVQTAPAITTQPMSQVVCAGTNVTFTVVATGSVLTYQWELSTDGGTIYTPIGGATSASYTITGVTIPMNGNRYRVVVSGACPAPVTSNAAVLTVGDGAMITAQPQPQTVCSPATATFSATATGSSLTYQWQVSSNGGTTYTNITGATASTYTTGPTAAAMNGNLYRVVVFSCTPTGINSNDALLTVNTPVAVSAQPSDQTVCQGASTSFTVTAAGTGITYQWQYSATGCGGTFTNITGATSATYTIASPTPANNGGYRVVVTGTCNTVTSTCATLLVNTPIAITTQPAAQSVCIPNVNSAMFSVAVTGTAPTYQWQVSTNGGTTYTNITGATAASYTVTPLAVGMNGNLYRVLVSGTCTTTPIASAAALLTVNVQVAISAQPTNKSVCAPDATSFSVTATGTNIMYQWQVSINNGPFVNLTNTAPYSGVTTATLNIAPTSVDMSGYRYRVFVSNTTCGGINSNTVTLTVNARPVVILSLNNNTAITPYIRTTLGTTVSPAGNYNYAWYKNGVLVPSFTAANIPVTVDDPGEYYVIVTDVATGCGTTSNRVTVTIAASDQLFVYPNPNFGRFQVRYYNAGGASIDRTLIVVDSKGAKVFSQQFTGITGPYGKMDVDLKIVETGVYHIMVMDKSGKKLATSSVLIKSNL